MMANDFFQFKQFHVSQQHAAMKVSTDSCLFGAWVAREVVTRNQGDGEILDIGTGTGLLSLMLAQKTTGQIKAIEIDDGAAEDAAHNFSKSPWHSRINLKKGDITEQEWVEKFDLIIVNPPFYEGNLRSPDKKINQARHDESLPLINLVAVIVRMLKKSGTFYILLPEQRKEELISIISSENLAIGKIMTVRQATNSKAFRVMVSGNFNLSPAGFEESLMAIKETDGNYTTEFINLLQDYYLYL